jgi:ethanolamine utilization protein EutA
VAWDTSGRIERLEEAGRIAGGEFGVSLEVGGPLTGENKVRLARALAASVVDMITGDKESSLTEKLLMTPMLAYRGVIDGLVFSGGVSEYVYGHETQEFGDLGLLLGGEIRSRIEQPGGVRGIPLVAASERIRATVIGSCQFTLQLSGDTIHVVDSEMLPIRNVPVVPIDVNGDITLASVREAILHALENHDILHPESRFALALRLPPFLGYGVVEPLAGGIAQALDGSGPPVVIVFEQNIAGVVGEKLGTLAKRKFVCIDEIVVHELDYIDVGKREEDQAFVPVVVKSLVFHTPRWNDGRAKELLR